MNTAFPLSIDSFGRTATVDDDAHIRQMIELFLFTDSGERVNRPDFGSGIRQLVHAANSEELAVATRFTVQAGLQRWLSDLIEVRSVDVAADEAILKVRVSYMIRRTNESRTAELSSAVG